VALGSGSAPGRATRRRKSRVTHFIEHLLFKARALHAQDIAETFDGSAAS
jgi:hypothetical protein